MGDKTIVTIDPRAERLRALLAGEFARTPSILVRYAVIDGLPGFISIEGGGIVQTPRLKLMGKKSRQFTQPAIRTS